MKNFTKIVAIILLIPLLIMSLSACGRLSSKQVAELLRENGYDINDSMVEVVLDEELSAQAPNLHSKGDRFALLEIGGIYSTHIVNLKSRTIDGEGITYSSPLYHIIPTIRQMDRDINTQLYAIEKNYIEQYGVDCFSEQDYAEQCLRDITDKNILSVEDAREMVKAHCATQAQDRAVEVFFEDGNAVPMYYLTQATDWVYNWDFMWSEEQYKMFVKDVLDHSTQQSIAYLYGAPYVQKTVWVTSDSDGNDAGTYNSLEEAKKKLLGKNDTDKNNEALSGKSENNQDNTNSTAYSNKKENYDKILIVATNADYAPFEYFDDNGKIVGFDIDLISKLASDIGFNLKFINKDFDGIIYTIQNGEADIVISAICQTPEREQYADFSDIYYVEHEYDEIEKEYYDVECRIAVKKDSNLLPEINKYLAKYKSNGFIDDLVEKYMLDKISYDTNGNMVISP